MRSTFLLAFFFAVAACGPEDSQFGGEPPQPERQNEIPVSERARLLPTDLFTLVYNGQTDKIAEFAKTHPADLSAQNADGDTPLGLALKLGLRQPARELLKLTTPNDLFHLNYENESYVFLAARAGFHEAITWLGELYASSIAPPLPASFSDLDVKNNLGQTAIFVAADRNVAKALEAQYDRDAWGLVEVPVVGDVRYYFWDFLIDLDTADRNFLHMAALEGRSDTIVWASERHCAPGEWESSDEWYLSVPSSVLTFGWSAVEAYLPEEWLLNSPSSQLFNRQDADGGTPLHIAAAHRQMRSIRALASCRWINVDLTDGQGDLPLHTFLKALNPVLTNLDDETRETFKFLLNQGTYFYEFYTSIADRVDTENDDGDTTLHLAARLADPFFYNLLKEYGDIYAVDSEGVSAESRFQARQQQVARESR